MISGPELPEVYGLIGTFVFIVLSLYTAVFDNHYHKGLPYLYQVAAVAGFGQLFYGSIFGLMQTRFFLNLSYVVFSLANVVGLFAWMLYKRGGFSNLLKYVYFFSIVIPSSVTVILVYFGYLQLGPLPLSFFPLEFSPLLLVMSAIGVFVGALATYKPESLRAIANVVSVKVKLGNKIRKKVSCK